MKAILEFNLPEENKEYATALFGDDLYIALKDYENHLRSQYKYEGITDISIEKVRSDFYSFFKDVLAKIET